MEIALYFAKMPKKGSPDKDETTRILKGENEKGLKLLSKIEFNCDDPSFLNSVGDIYFHLKNSKKAQLFYLKSYI